MNRVRIIGAGSIGNHLAFGFINSEFNVEIVDNDKQALSRMKNDIYPSRYGKWDNRIILSDSLNSKNYTPEVIVIGTPPNTHIEIALEQLKLTSPKILMIEKPLSHPDISLLETLEKEASKKKVKVLVGYNHRLTKNTVFATKILREQRLGEVLSITSQTRESWNGIMKAHPWIAKLEDSYLSSYLKGGGALYEHSHALNLLQYFMDVTEAGNIVKVQAAIDIVCEGKLNYDRFSFLSLLSEKNKIFHVIQDVVTNPPIKEVRINGTNGDLIWRTTQDFDEVTLFDTFGSAIEQHKIQKTRKDDFLPEILHIKNLLLDLSLESPLDYKHALTTMKIISAAFESNRTGARVNLN